MSSIVPPLDKIPKLPGKAVSLAIKEIDKQTNILLSSVSETVADSIKLPKDIKCDDPRIVKIKKQLTDIQTQLTKVQTNIPKIQQTANTLKQIVSAAVGIKSAISAAQLANPVTAGLFIAQQLTAIQDATIVNAIESLNQFSSVPATLTSKLQIIVPPLMGAITKLSGICNGDIDNLELPSDVVNTATTTTDYNNVVPTEFYTEKNVSQSDLDNRSDTIELLLQQQQNLLTSLLEAPSKVYQNQGPPAMDLGKPGDYYIDLDTQTVYGPKLSINNW